LDFLRKNTILAILFLQQADDQANSLQPENGKDSLTDLHHRDGGQKESGRLWQRFAAGL